MTKTRRKLHLHNVTYSIHTCIHVKYNISVVWTAWIWTIECIEAEHSTDLVVDLMTYVWNVFLCVLDQRIRSLRVLNSSFELNFQISSFSLSFSIEYWLATLVHCVLVSFIQIQFYFLRTNLQPFVKYINILKGWSHSEKEYSFGCEFFYLWTDHMKYSCENGNICLTEG